MQCNAMRFDLRERNGSEGYHGKLDEQLNCQICRRCLMMLRRGIEGWNGRGKKGGKEG